MQTLKPETQASQVQNPETPRGFGSPPCYDTLYGRGGQKCSDEKRKERGLIFRGGSGFETRYYCTITNR